MGIEHIKLRVGNWSADWHRSGYRLPSGHLVDATTYYGLGWSIFVEQDIARCMGLPEVENVSSKGFRASHQSSYPACGINLGKLLVQHLKLRRSNLHHAKSP